MRHSIIILTALCCLAAFIGIWCKNAEYIIHPAFIVGGVCAIVTRFLIDCVS